MPRLPIKFNQLDEMMSHIWNELIDEFKQLTYEETSTEEI